MDSHSILQDNQQTPPGKLCPAPDFDCNAFYSCTSSPSQIKENS